HLPIVIVFVSPLSSFSSSAYRVQLDLHSFPTRRSSDLVRLLALRVLDDLTVPELEPLVGAVIGDVVLVGETVRHRLEQVVLEAQDRKSTRLNSSHVKISYAVFCLKKKK